MSNSRLVYSTDGGRTCPKCGWPLTNCQCSKTLSSGKEAVPELPPHRAESARRGPRGVVAKLRMEKKGRGGKTVTVVYGLPNNTEFLENLCSELKKACGCGGATTEDGVELQGELRDRIRPLLEKKGFAVKG